MTQGDIVWSGPLQRDLPNIPEITGSEKSRASVSHARITKSTPVTLYNRFNVLSKKDTSKADILCRTRSDFILSRGLGQAHDGEANGPTLNRDLAAAFSEPSVYNGAFTRPFKKKRAQSIKDFQAQSFIYPKAHDVGSANPE